RRVDSLEMRNLFDDFLDELKRREAAARGEDPGPPSGRRGPDDDPDTDGDEDTVDEPGDGANEDDGGPRPIFEPRRAEPPRRGGPPRRRGPGGPNDGARSGG